MKEKQFKVKPAEKGMYEVYVEDGGAVPQTLKQLFTDPITANKHIQRYLNTRRDYPSRGRTKKAAANGSGSTESDV